MLIDIGPRETVTHIVDNVLDVIRQPYLVDGHAFAISTCIGISTYPQEGEDIDSLLQHADLAMYTAKQRGANRYHFYGDC